MRARIIRLAWLPILLVGALCGGAAAQRTWIVDVNNGPGTDFTTVRQAFAAVRDGDSVVVRAGVYLDLVPAVLSRRVRVYVDPAAAMLVSIEVTNVAAGPGSVVFVGVATMSPMALRSNRAHIHFEDSSIPSHSTIDDCDLVTMNNCQLGPGSSRHGVTVSRSELRLTNCGQTSTFGATMIAVDSTISLNRSVLRGSFGRPLVNCYIPLVVTNCDVFISRESGVHQATAGFCANMPAIAAMGSRLRIDPAVMITGAISSDRPIVRGSVPSLSVSGAPPGGVINSVILGAPNAMVLVGLSPPTRSALTALGPFGLNPLSTQLVGTGLTSASGSFAQPIPVPPISALSGSAWTTQALIGTRLSLPGSFTIKR